MNLYSIYKCGLSDVDKLVFFIDVYWKKNHPLAISRELLNFQHYDKECGEYNFILAENNLTKEIDAIIGFIPIDQYDKELKSNGDYWGAIWKIREDIQNDEINSVGYFIWKKMFKLPNFTSYAAIGISNIAKQIYQASRLRTGVLNQYYILREQNIPYKIALAPINNGSIVSASVNRIKKINIDKGVFIKAFYRPYKSVAYLINRYKLHPVYKYEFWNVNEQCLLVVRKICVENRSVIRIVDCLGSLNDMPDLYADFQLMLREEDAEYIDFMNYGINEEVFAKMGFQKLDHDGDVIIPNYFEPFERRNVKIEFAYKADFDYVIFKGDSDQDRPNIL